MFGAKKDLTYSIWLTPHELHSLESGNVMGKLQVGPELLKNCRIALLPDHHPSPAAQVEESDRSIRIRFTRDYFDLLFEEGSATLLTDNMELVNLFDVARNRGPAGRMI